jgi:hypothetical protein
MNDRELLEAAATAAGIALTPMVIKPVDPADGDGFIGFMTRPHEWPRGWFNPLTDDGDALRLAVKLRLCISRDECECCVWASPGPDSMGDGDACVIERMNEVDSPRPSLEVQAAATRRAIVRAAASIGTLDSGDSGAGRKPMTNTPAEARMPVALADYTQDQVDALSHGQIADRLRRYNHPWLQSAADSIDYLAAQEGLLEKAQQDAMRAVTELAEHKRPLDAEMARLNRRVIELTGELDALRLRLPMPPTREAS